MDWTFLAALIVKVGLEGAYQIFQWQKKGEPPTQEEWDILFKIVAKSHDKYIEEAKSKLPV